MGKSGERGHEGEPGIKVPIVVTLLILCFCDSSIQSRIYSDLFFLNVYNLLVLY